tara:strand:+ start:8403 stop:10214 length:1812 start_codon:yes stop_codon:yes gene_type:complete
MKFRNNKTIKKKGGSNPLKDGKFLQELTKYKKENLDSYNDFISNSTASTDTISTETSNENDDFAFGPEFTKELNDISNISEEKKIKMDRENEIEKNRANFEKHISPIKYLSQPQRAVKMITQDKAPVRISDEHFKGHIFDLKPVKEDLFEKAFIKDEAKKFVSDISDRASIKVYNQDLKLKSMVEQDAIQERYKEKMDNLNKKKKLQNEKMESEIKLKEEKTKKENEKFLQEESLDNFSNFLRDDKLLPPKKISSEALESIDINEMIKKIDKIKFIVYPYDSKFYYYIKEKYFKKGNNDYLIISNNWSFYNTRIGIDERNYNEIFGNIDQEKLNNIIDVMIKRTYEIISTMKKNSIEKFDLCAFILVLLKIKYFNEIDMSDQLTKRGYGGKKITNCCNHTKKHKLCIRKNDKKLFKLPRRFTKKQCKNPRGFTMKASCAPYKNCGGGKKKKATCKLVNKSRKYKIDGKITIEELPSKGLKLNYNISGLTPGKHGFHIHEFGDLNNKCMNCGSHFNPFKKNHCKTLKNCHLGDLGNVVANKNGIAKGSKFTPYLCLKKNKKCNVINRSIIVHDKKDDLGKGKNEESKKTGNAGKRLACGIIKLI